MRIWRLDASAVLSCVCRDQWLKVCFTEILILRHVKVCSSVTPVVKGGGDPLVREKFSVGFDQKPKVCFTDTSGTLVSSRSVMPSGEVILSSSSPRRVSCFVGRSPMSLIFVDLIMFLASELLPYTWMIKGILTNSSQETHQQLSTIEKEDHYAPVVVLAGLSKYNLSVLLKYLSK